jgi:hypothetical protein
MQLNAIALTAVLAAASLASAGFVNPMMGGGQVGMMSAPMIHTDIAFDGTHLVAHTDTSHGTPVLRALPAGMSFDPTQPWSVLGTKDYNYQYAWNWAGDLPPSDTVPVIERVRQDSDLDVFKRPPATPAWAPLFQADGEKWQWTGHMTHNAYAVQNPTRSTYSADYIVYLADPATLEPLPQYNTVAVTWTWSVIPEPSAALPAVGVGPVLLLRRRRLTADRSRPLLRTRPGTVHLGFSCALRAFSSASIRFAESISGRYCCGRSLTRSAHS